MNENELLKNLSLLKRIEPSKNWVLFTKTRILGHTNPIRIGQVGHIIDTFSFIFNRPAFAVAGFAVLIASGLLFQFNQQRLAQDAVVHLALAQQRLEQLQKIAESANKGDFKGGVIGDLKGDLSAALKEFQEASAQLSQGLPQFASKNHAKALQAGIGILQLQKSVKGFEKVFGVAVGEQTQEELQIAARTLIENEFADLSTRTLNTQQQALFEQAKSAFDTGDYQTALEKIWAVSN